MKLLQLDIQTDRRMLFPSGTKVLLTFAITAVMPAMSTSSRTHGKVMFVSLTHSEAA
jgi:hypothetical protein